MSHVDQKVNKKLPFERSASETRGRLGEMSDQDENQRRPATERSTN